MSRSQEKTGESPTTPPTGAEGKEPHQTRDGNSVATEDGHPVPMDGAAQVAGEEAGTLRREFEELNDRHLRLVAEFDNFRRRSQTEMAGSGIRAQANLVGGILDILDDFERVTTLDPEQATVQSVLEGVRLMEQKLHRVLMGAGLEVVDPTGETFDPNVMEAMMRVPTDSPDEDGEVAQVFQKGFVFKGHLLRPARVSVRVHE
ncbi:MAG: nucleotide exchange factor GrpE [Gemmatimonadales bacterium]|nr:MAG: nucleotide exchange factor GrpE [Gemmatimonadales bacterium]